MDVMRIDRLSLAVRRAILLAIFIQTGFTMLLDAVREQKVVIFLEHGRPILISLPIGAAVVAMTGTVWLTQDGLTTDIILRRGDKFDVAQKGSIVVNAVDGPGRVHVTQSPRPGPRPHLARKIAAILTNLAAPIFRKTPRVTSIAIEFELTNRPFAPGEPQAENRKKTVFFGSTAYGFRGLIQEHPYHDK